MKYLGNTAWDAGVSLQELNHFLSNLILKKGIDIYEISQFQEFLTLCLHRDGNDKEYKHSTWLEFRKEY